MNSSCVKCQYLPHLVNTGSYGWLVESSVWKKKKKKNHVSVTLPRWAIWLLENIANSSLSLAFFNVLRSKVDLEKFWKLHPLHHSVTTLSSSYPVCQMQQSAAGSPCLH